MRKEIKEAYDLLDPKEQESIQEMHSHFEMVYKIGEWLSEEATMVFDMIIDMPFKDGEETLENLDGDIWVSPEEISLDLNSLLGIDG